MDKEVLVSVNNVSKKFCSDLKTSLFYGAIDVVRELFALKKVERLRKKEFWAIENISFELRRGECLGLIGHNGAGKSTILKMLNGLINPDKGSIQIRGKVGALIELGAGFNPVLTGRENIYINGQILGFSKKEIDQKFQSIVDFAEIERFLDTPVRNYSSGMKVRLGFAVAAQMEPDVLIIDEVLAVGDVAFRNKCFTVLSKLVRKAAVILVSHSMPQIGRHCTRGLFLEQGKILQDGEIKDTIEKYYSKIESIKANNTIENGAILDKISIQNKEVNKDSDVIEISHGENLRFDILTKFEETIQKVKFRILIINSDNQAILFCTSEEIEISNRKTLQTLILKNIYLKSGSYFVSLEVQSEDEKVTYLYHDAEWKFKVIGGKNDYGAAFISYPTNSWLS